MSAAGSGATSLLAALDLSARLPHLVDILREQDYASCCNLLSSGGRVSLLANLKHAGVGKLSERQLIANSLGKAIRSQPPTRLLPGDERLFLTPWNWALAELGDELLAVTNTPGAYAKMAWTMSTVLASDANVVKLTIDASSMSGPSMTLGVSFDEAPFVAVPLPAGEAHAVVELPVPGTRNPGAHCLTLGMLNSVQRYDRWGSASALPENSLRLRSVVLPPGANAVLPAVRPYRMLAFGDSIVEGVGAEYRRGQSGDLLANRGLHTWVAALAARLNAEFSSVGFGRLAWTIGGNGYAVGGLEPPHPSGGLSAVRLTLCCPADSLLSGLISAVWLNLCCLA